MLKRLFKEHLLRQVDGLSLSVFRIVFFAVLLVEISSYIYYYALIKQDIPYISAFNVLEYSFLYVWLVVAVSLCLGLYTSYLSILNYVFAVYYFGTDLGHNYHVHYIFLCASTLMAFMPLGQSISIDALLAKKNGKAISGKVPAYVYVAFALFLLGFVYFDSAIYKWSSYYWTHGLCLWIGTSYIPIIKYDFSFLLNQKELMVIGNFASLIFETVFIFLLPWRKTRLLLVLYGVPMHLFIALLYPLPIFGVVFSVLYIVLVPSSYWRWLFDRSWVNTITNTIKQLILRLPLPYFPTVRFPVGIVWALLLLLILNQSIATAWPQVERFRVHLPGPIANATRAFYGFYYKTGFEHYTGVTHHSLFLDNHFAPRNVYAMYYKSDNGKLLQLPFTDSRGLHSPQLQNIGWKLWCFYTMEDQNEIETFVKFSAFWAHRNQVNLSNATFVVRYKHIQAPLQWERDFLRKQIDMPWQDYATLTWKDKDWKIDLVDSEPGTK